MPDLLPERVAAAHPPTTWRLIPPLDLPGRSQMAIDRWLLAQYILGKIPPTLRFYTWSQPTISLGYHQHHYPAQWRDLVWHDRPVDLVKRPTGGRGVLHQGDLTYAFVGSGFGGNRVEVYQQICQFLVDGWRSIGVELSYGNTGSGYIHNPNCFGTATSADLVCTDGYKLIGSAQLIKSDAILQHGSMRINPDRTLFEQVFGAPIAPPPALSQLATATIIDTLVAAAQQHFDINFATAVLTDREWAEIRAIEQS